MAFFYGIKQIHLGSLEVSLYRSSCFNIFARERILMLFEPERHTPLAEIDFDESRIEEAIQKIVTDTFIAAKSTPLFPVHPKDFYEGAPAAFTDFYMGAAGVIWALNELQNFSEHDLTYFCRVSINEILMKHVARNEATTKGSYFVGEAGIRLIKERLDPVADNEQALVELVEGMMDSLANELLYGLPGSLLIARFLLGQSRKAEYETLNNRIVEKLFSVRKVDETSGALIWEQQFQKKLCFLGAGHGTVGNYSILLRNPALQADQRKDILSNLEKLLHYYASTEGDLCNWPVFLDRPFEGKPADKKFHVHWCHGAKGVVTELGTSVSVGESILLDQLLVQAGNLIWNAGPLEKGVSLCHGTAGSGMAFLKLYERTRDPVWLARAQRFAMHALEQSINEQKDFGQLRFSLWTGDLGLAIFLRDVLTAKSRMPGLDYI